MRILLTDQFIRTAVETISNHIKVSLIDQGYFVLGLSGGNTPRPIYEALADEEGIDWSKVIITFGDERAVPPDHADSNFKMANDSLLSKINILESNVLRMEGELDPVEAATRYEARLIETANKLGMKTLHHDLLLLGLGDDGHTASLFPETEALHETNHLCVANRLALQNTTRLTLTYPVINQAKKILFLLSGPEKSNIANEVINTTTNHPAGLVNPNNGEITWLLGWLPEHI